MDLSSLDSVAQAARTVTTESDHLDILMLNAGVMAAPPGLTQDGYELQFGTNYLGHALLAKLLLPLLERTAASSSPQDVRIVAISSHGYVYAPQEGVLFDSLRKPADDLGAFGRYGQSKLAMVLWTRYLARKYPQFTCASIHPGVVRTNLMNNATGSPPIIRLLGKVTSMIFTSVDQGVRNQLWASVSKDVKSGEYYEPVGIGGPVSPLGEDDALAQRIWDWTEKELERYVTGILVDVPASGSLKHRQYAVWSQYAQQFNLKAKYYSWRDTGITALFCISTYLCVFIMMKLRSKKTETARSG
ncbi:uncharacterized protein ASPGLDRAFT_1071129 [Aspergillus glaucus CBS 516.65]|uniref:Uncharacterized protein n=1 Tax=Aspergillus glaucus CBS 516.65 TaxID=1160497 RepID=A0A1L9V5F5_ASPGL|nr:hypothetical protein ASPGLDRAFT_1071129 [Aspergillus glaucus CBS 516.65]OJJ79099.1 hypothetical protein ASPGLDRAFT_1071129 [Aspergillus glaucus CBS 516.65]